MLHAVLAVSVCRWSSTKLFCKSTFVFTIKHIREKATRNQKFYTILLFDAQKTKRMMRLKIREKKDYFFHFVFSILNTAVSSLCSQVHISGTSVCGSSVLCVCKLNAYAYDASQSHSVRVQFSSTGLGLNFLFDRKHEIIHFDCLPEYQMEWKNGKRTNEADFRK